MIEDTDKAATIVRKFLDLNSKGQADMYDDLLKKTGYIALNFVEDNDGKISEIIGVAKFAFTTAIVVGVDFIGYERRYCYEHVGDALMAFLDYEGEGDPSGPWIKEKPSERLGPGALQ